MLFLKVFTESIRQAWAQLVGNKLRTFLSLLGISIGIFCIIGVLSAVDSLEDNVSGSLAKLGDDVLYVQKWPMTTTSENWFNYIQRPYPDHADYEVLREELPTAQLALYYTVPGSRTLKYRRNTVEGAFLFVSTFELDRMFNIEIEKGRYLTASEYNRGSAKLLLGHTIAEELFGALEPVGKTIKLSGRKYEVIGVLKKSGGELFNPLKFDDAILLGYNNAARFINMRNRSKYDGSVAVRAAEGVTVEQLEDDIRGVLRSHRRLKPIEDDNFSMMALSMIAEQVSSVFGVLNIIGWIIGLFSTVVGMISVANIMFVSVKERTSLIGVKKALGARSSVILLEFLTESVILCVIGGLMGLIIVVGATSVINQNMENFAIVLSTKNAILGVILSAVVGILAGLAPARQAAAMDPVDAMRS